MTDYLLLANEIMAVIAVLTLALSFRGFWPHLLRNVRGGDWKSAPTWMYFMVLVMDIKGIFRMTYWDIWRPFRGLLYEEGVALGSLEGSLVNAGVNFLAFLAGLAGLYVLLYSIPKEERGEWSILTAPFYPRKLSLWIWR